MPRWNLVVCIKWFIIGRISLNPTSSTIRKWISRSRFIILMRDRYLRLIWTRWTLRWIEHRDKNVLFKSCPSYSNYMRHISSRRWNTYAAAERKLANNLPRLSNAANYFSIPTLLLYDATGKRKPSVNNEFAYRYETLRFAVLDHVRFRAKLSADGQSIFFDFSRPYSNKMFHRILYK